MSNEEITLTECMLVAVYKKLDKIEKKLGNGMRMASDYSYYKELKEEAEKIRNAIINKQD